MKFCERRKGTTLGRILIVTATLIVVAMFVIPSISGFVQQVKDDNDLKNARLILTSSLLAASVKGRSPGLDDLPLPQGKTGAFQVWNDKGKIEVYIAGSTNYSYSPELDTFIPDVEIPISSGNVVELTP